MDIRESVKAGLEAHAPMLENRWSSVFSDEEKAVLAELAKSPTFQAMINSGVDRCSVKDWLVTETTYTAGVCSRLADKITRLMESGVLTKDVLLGKTTISEGMGTAAPEGQDMAQAAPDAAKMQPDNGTDADKGSQQATGRGDHSDSTGAPAAAEPLAPATPGPVPGIPTNAPAPATDGPKPALPTEAAEDKDDDDDDDDDKKDDKSDKMSEAIKAKIAEKVKLNTKISETKDAKALSALHEQRRAVKAEIRGLKEKRRTEAAKLSEGKLTEAEKATLAAEAHIRKLKEARRQVRANLRSVLEGKTGPVTEADVDKIISSWSMSEGMNDRPSDKFGGAMHMPEPGPVPTAEDHADLPGENKDPEAVKADGEQDLDNLGSPPMKAELDQGQANPTLESIDKSSGHTIAQRLALALVDDAAKKYDIKEGSPAWRKLFSAALRRVNQYRS